MTTTTTSTFFVIDGDNVGPTLLGLSKKLVDTSEEVVLDFTSVHRLDANAIQAMDVLARLVDDKRAKIALHGISVEIYKVLKLARLAERFSAIN